MPLLLAAALTLLQSSTQLLAGTWDADLTRSTQHPGYEFKSVTFEITVAGHAVTIADTHLYANGKATSGVHTFQADGVERPFDAPAVGPGLSVVAQWNGQRALDTVVRKGSQEIARVVYTVSADGQTLTATRTGLVAQVVVFERK